MNMTPNQLERYSFLWSEARLVIAAVALFLGGVPPLLAINRNPALIRPLWLLLTVAWIISGLAAGYLIYRWNLNRKVLFGGRKPLDTGAFFVCVISGINLGLAGLIRTNIGMAISSSKSVFIIVGLLYLAAAIYLWQRWNSFGKKVF